MPPSSSEKQRRFFGLIRGIQKGTSHGSARAEKVAHEISPQDASDFASKVKKKRHGISKSLMKKGV